MVEINEAERCKFLDEKWNPKNTVIVAQKEAEPEDWHHKPGRIKLNKFS
jgi:hypothetical protein